MKTIEEVKEHIYQHITQDTDMGVPPDESWDGIIEGDDDWVDESIKSGFTIEQLRGEIFEEVLEKWEKDHPEFRLEDDLEDEEEGE